MTMSKMNHTKEQIELVARALYGSSGMFFAWDALIEEAHTMFRQQATALLDQIAALSDPPATPAHPEDEELSADWWTGNGYVLDRLCAVLKVDKNSVVWDGSDGSMDEETDSVIWRILEQSKAATPALDAMAMQEAAAKALEVYLVKYYETTVHRAESIAENCIRALPIDPDAALRQA